MSDPAVCLKGLTKQYREVLAVDSLDLTVRKGEIYGFLGRNGAGKTTTIRMMLGLIKPTSGRAEIFGHPVEGGRSAAVIMTGSLVETATAYPTLTARENLIINARLLGLPMEETDRVMELLGISELADRRAGRLSLGNRQRLALARALLGSPELLILDEPANALDPAGIVEIRKLLRRLADEKGITVFVSSHILGEISLLADRIGIIHRGRLIEERSVSQWNGSAHPEGYRIATDDNGRALEILKGVCPSGTLIWDGQEEHIHLKDTAADPAVIAAELIHGGMGLKALIPLAEDLEARFLKITGDEL